MDFDDFGVVEKLTLSAIQRHQNHRQPTNIDTFRGHESTLYWTDFDELGVVG